MAAEMPPAQVCPQRLRCEYHVNPLGIDVLTPRLSWQLSASGRGVAQTACQIQVAASPAGLEGGRDLLWDTGKVATAESLHHTYRGPALRSGQRCFWRVRVWDQDGQPTPWSEAAWWEMGLLSAGDWRARWIEPPWDEDPQVMQPCPYLRTAFTLRGPVAAARAYVTSHGLYEMTLNGLPVTEDIFTPGFTAYHKRLQYQTYDVAALLRPGENALGVILGDGWWRGKVGVFSVRNAYGARLALLLQLRILYEDGSEQWVTTGEGWRATTGPILRSDLKDGEVYDARREMPGWDAPGFDDSDWQAVRIADYGVQNLVAPAGVPVRRHEEFRPVRIIHTPAGETVVDMGQNFAGRVRLRVRGPAGTTIILQHGETLDKAGNFTMKNLEFGQSGAPQQKVTYTLKGEGEEVYEPRFTFHGFRYVRVEGFPGEPGPDNFTGIAIYSDMVRTGDFDCSDPLINQLQSNIVWSQKSNFLDIPTDCPQRERAGWTGDAQIFARTGSFIMDTAAFFTKWLQDLAVEQHPDGMVTNLVPDAFAKAGGFAARLEGSSGWGDAALIVPWTMYLCFADRRILERQYPSMKAWVDYEARQAAHVHWVRRLEPSYWLSAGRRARQRYIWDTKYQWGEWLEPGTNWLTQGLGMFWRMAFGDPPVATAYLAFSSGLLARIARLLNMEEDARRYQTLHEQVKAAWVAEFVAADGRIRPDKQASYVRALAFDLLPEALRPLAARRLVELVRRNGNHLGTGFLTTTYLCHVLSRYGYLDVAYDLLNQKTIPSWLYPITKGATSIWESWDGIKPDGSVFASLNHYSYGAVGSWLYQVVAGIELDPEAPGYQHLYIQPQPGGGLSRAGATYESVYGRIASVWERAGGRMRLEVTIPPNTRATVRLPGAQAGQVTESGLPVAGAAGIADVRQQEGATVLEAGSGQYRFEYPVEG